MRNVFFLCFFTLLGTCVSAQTIKGQLTDGASQEPMGFANVSVYDANDKLVKGTSSGIDGRYEIIDLPAGTYQLEASFLGYATVSVQKVMGLIVLISLGDTLGE